ncbi:condensation domain-containing protein [Rhodococcoides kyotonense]|uniref:Condensation domain-containing protein n=1 Tax=Rhodococcoides kyotonense TaxID=398843 RepID=A0A239LXS4_9NOCA|nr:condensation domain-containing protein [Rhodococcus kyotonensis]SNT34603.1 Condensation domain-containing protein [Rhodococcus kyotonensis]
MQVTSITEYVGAAGTYLEWPVSIGDGVLSDVAPSFNQSFHLSAALENAEDTSTVWIAVAFDVPGRIDVDALSWAFAQFVERHPALRTSFYADSTGVRRRIHSPAEVEIGSPVRTRIFDSSSLSTHVRVRMNALCHPSRSPSYSFAAVDRRDRSTVLCGFDHAHVDAVSMTVAAEEIASFYTARRTGRQQTLESVGSFVEYCRTEADTPAADVSDPRIASWADFVAGCGGTTPMFPFDLGVPQGSSAPQATSVHAVASDEDTERFEHRCRELGAGMFAGVAAALAQASSNIGGPTQLPLLFPLHTRRDPQFSRAVGWFTTNAPMTVTVGADFDETVTAAHASFRAALPLAAVPIPRVLEALGENFHRSRQDVFMVSYIDYRGVPGADCAESNAHHISNVTTADDAQFWVSRTRDGLSLRSRFPDTPEAHRIIENIAAELTRVLAAHVTTSVAAYELSLVGPRA